MKHVHLVLFAAVLFLFSCAHRSTQKPSDVKMTQAALAADMDSLLKNVSASSAVKRKLRDIYQLADYLPLWLNASSVSELNRAIADVESHGMNSKKYQFDVSNQSPPQAEVQLTATYLTLLSDIRIGQIDPLSVDPEWHLPKKERFAPGIDDIKHVAEPVHLLEFINSQYPHSGEYNRLRAALKKLQLLQKSGGWSALSSETVLRPGDRDMAHVPELRKRLEFSGDLSRTDSQANVDLFDSDIENALRRFQQRHGLTVSGVLNAETLRELNVSVDERIRQVKVNLERWRWLPKDLGKTYVAVNVADYRLAVVSEQRVINSMSVVVGKEFRKTPLFASEMAAVELNPKWLVPQKLAREDILPLLRSDAQALLKKGFHFYDKDTGKKIDPTGIDWQQVNEDDFSYKVVQDAGPLNALGKVKFWLPNDYGIFMHDTPGKELFEKKVRTFSAGCIRLEKPFELAEFLLQHNPEFKKADFHREITVGTNKKIKINSPLPVYLLYWTAWVDENEELQFRSDIYGLNWELDQKLNAPIQ